MSNKELSGHKEIVKAYIHGLKKLAKNTAKIIVSNSGHSKRDYSKKEYASFNKMDMDQFLFMEYPKWSDKKMTLLKQFVCDFWNHKKNNSSKEIIFDLKDLNPIFVQERKNQKKNTIYDKWPNIIANCLPEIFSKLGKDTYIYNQEKAVSFFNGGQYNPNNLFKLIVYRNRLYDYICYLDWYENNHKELHKELNDDIFISEESDYVKVEYDTPTDGVILYDNIFINDTISISTFDPMTNFDSEIGSNPLISILKLVDNVLNNKESFLETTKNINNILKKYHNEDLINTLEEIQIFLNDFRKRI